MKITWYGTASLSIETALSKILIDPFLTPRGSENRTSLQDFAGYDTILLTHGHLDHIQSIPKILEGNEAVVFCTATPAETLERKGVPGERIMEIQPGIQLAFRDIRVTVLKGKHIQYDRKLVEKTFLSWRMLRYAYRIPSMFFQNRAFRENGETVTYLLEAAGKSVLILGSMGLDEEEEYPEKVDILVLPFQGMLDPSLPAAAVIDRIRPGMVMLDHFDDAFPPFSKTVDTRSLKKLLDKRDPDLCVVKPKAGKTYCLD
ncbi:MAG: MBL fold metallo-hydrolase [Candidatus Limivivens sp.]|nr:MBL fold metallo-hydrolase [Candidatus Limivivens sp.]